MDVIIGACTPAGRCVLEGFPPGADGLAVPVHPVVNPSRGEWLATPGALLLVLPAGRCTVEVGRPRGRTDGHTVELVPEQTSVFRVPGAPGGG